MAKTVYTRNNKVRKHTNRTTGSHMNGKKIDSKMNRKNKLYFKGKKMCITELSRILNIPLTTLNRKMSGGKND